MLKDEKRGLFDMRPSDLLRLGTTIFAVGMAYASISADLRHIDSTLARHEVMIMQVIKGEFKSGTP